VAAGNAERIDERARSTHAALTEEYLSMRHETHRLLAMLKAEHLKAPFRFWWDEGEPERTVLDYVVAFPEHERMHREQLRPAMRYVRAMGGA
jgi:hypothetical protein